MKNVAFHVVALALVLATAITAGCSKRVSIRLFNGIDREISIVTAIAGEFLTIPPGQSQEFAPWMSERAGFRGFVVVDRGQELFYAVMPVQQTFPAGTQLLHQASAQHRLSSVVYFIEYAADSFLFALVPGGVGFPVRVAPEPHAFPAKPNKAPEPTPGAVTPRATEGASK